MSSENAAAVAREVIKTVKKGKQVILKEIIKNQGYSDSVADAPTRVTQTQSYQKAIQPLTKGLMEEIEKIKAEMANRDISQERYETLANVLDKLVKNYQLLSGGATTNFGIQISLVDLIKKAKNES